MCGIAGLLTSPNRHAEAHCAIAKAMGNAIAHRGPDDQGDWGDADSGVFLAHRRLSIVDLSPAGHQPMASAGNRYIIVFNGEIYNHTDLRQELESSRGAPSWRGHSDTETLLAAIEHWGVEATLPKLVGMFAFALWDRALRTLTLVRDRLGEKPLYYGWVRGALVFASELKAIRAYPGFDNPLERRALGLFVRHSYVPAPWSIHQDVWKLMPGCYVQFSQVERGPGAVRPYWSARAVAESGLQNPYIASDEEALDELERLLRQSISSQMIADVPLGAFLSGGIDSTTVVALMQAQSQRPVKTFTMGFHDGEYNEADHAKAIARHLGTEHMELYVTAREAMDVIPKLPELYDEPFADSSQIPTFLVSRLAGQHVKVALSGDGGDQLFGGYNRHMWAPRLWKRISPAPASLRRAAARGLTTFSPQGWNSTLRMLMPLLPGGWRYSNLGDKLHKLAGLLNAEDSEALFRQLVSHWAPDQLVLSTSEPSTPITDPHAWLDCADLEQRMMYLDTITYLPDDILAKVDRAAMGVSLETRVPMLDHRVVEFAWQLPLGMKIRVGQGKWLLRQLLYRHVPRTLIERPKMGFGVPLDGWLRGPLREWAETLLSEERLRREGYLDPKPVRQKWAEHLEGGRNWSYHLWDILMFQAWLEDQTH